MVSRVLTDRRKQCACWVYFDRALLCCDAKELSLPTETFGTMQLASNSGKGITSACGLVRSVSLSGCIDRYGLGLT